MNAITKGLGDYSSSVCLYATAFWMAWITVIYSSDTIVVPIGSTYATSSLCFIISTLFLGATLLLCAVASTVIRPVLASSGAMAVDAVVSILASLGVSYAGMLPLVLFYVCAALTGVTTALLCARCSTLYAEVDPKRCLMSSSLSLVLGVLLYALFTMATFYFDTVLIAFVAACLPAIGVYVSFVPSNLPPSPEDDTTRKLSVSFWKIAIFLGVLDFGFSFVRGLYPKIVDITVFAATRGQVGIALILLGLGVLILVARKPRNASFSAYYYALFALSVCAVIPMLLAPDNTSMAGVVASLGNGLLCLVAWCFLCSVSFTSGMSALRVFGFGYGIIGVAMTLGFVAGDAVGTMAMHGVMENLPIIITVVYLAAALVLLREKDLAACMEPTDAMLASVEEAHPFVADGHEVEAPVAVMAVESPAIAAPVFVTAGVEDTEEAPRAKRGRFLQRCQQVASECGLSAREAEVMVLLAKGKEAQAIADELFISFNTARTHIRKIYVKLDIHSRRELMDYLDGKE